MTQIATAVPVPATAVAAVPTRRRSLGTDFFSGTPGRMRILAALAAAVALAFGVVGLLGLRAVEDSIDRASANIEQVARVQAVYVDLLKADAAVTNGFLVGGLESAEVRSTYDDAMGRVAASVAQGAQAQPADGPAFAALNQRIQEYAGDVDRARVYNRQGLPVGAAYLKQAGDSMRAQALPIVQNLVSANEKRADNEFRVTGLAGLVIGMGALTLIALLAIAAWLARRTHRWVNVPLALAIALVTSGLGLAINHVVQVSATMTKARSGDFDAAMLLADARAAAFDAKANESLSLIARGNGAANEAAFQEARGVAAEKLQALVKADPTTSGLRTLFGDYVVQHLAISKADESGKWNDAVALATATKDGSANERFAAFDEASAKALDRQVSGVVKTFDQTGRSTLPWIVGGLGVLASFSAARSMSKRIEEYR